LPAKQSSIKHQTATKQLIERNNCTHAHHSENIAKGKMILLYDAACSESKEISHGVAKKAKNINQKAEKKIKKNKKNKHGEAEPKCNGYIISQSKEPVYIYYYIKRAGVFTSISAHVRVQINTIYRPDNLHISMSS